MFSSTEVSAYQTMALVNTPQARATGAEQHLMFDARCGCEPASMLLPECDNRVSWFANGTTVMLGGELGGIGSATRLWTLSARALVPF